ncbi:MAG: hypothetical protein PBU97_18935 [Stenotrophomonas maltophilia]
MRLPPAAGTTARQFPREAWQRLLQPLQMQLVFRAVAEALG